MNSFPTGSPAKIKAVGLLSGGLDSFLSACLIRDQGIEVTVVFCRMPWGCGEEKRASALAEHLGMTFQVIELGDDYLALLRNPRYGYGSSFNPCLDCHIFMVTKAAELMRAIGADFVFTGEVLGQRPMSQRKDCLEIVAVKSGLEGRLLRPLSARLLPPTVPEIQGLVDRERLLDISGRSRQRQFALAKEWGLAGFSAPGGGCLLTDPFLGRRIKDFLAHGFSPRKNLAVLRWGRYFRVNPDTVVVVGRDERENAFLQAQADPDDILLELREVPGPLALLRSTVSCPETLAMAAGLVQRFSKFKDDPPRLLYAWSAGAPAEVTRVQAVLPTEAQVQGMVP